MVLIEDREKSLVNHVRFHVPPKAQPEWGEHRKATRQLMDAMREHWGGAVPASAHTVEEVKNIYPELYDQVIATAKDKPHDNLRDLVTSLVY